MTPRRRAISMLRTTCAVGAVIASGHAAPALAQGYQGNPSTVSGGVTVVRTPGRDDITITTATAVIDWTPFDVSPVGPIDFLPAANSVGYVGVGLKDFTVLNRILPNQSVPIMLNGAITSRIGGAAGGAQTVGGSIWIYSPGGIMVGGTSTFSVGGLLLTANAIPLNANNDFDPTVARFVGTAGSTSGISVAAGAQINAANYVALIAPKIVQAGAIRADGQIAYIAAETGTLTMPLGGGLFSIAIDVGGGTTVGGTAIDHSGTTGAAANPSPAGPRRVYVVTVAKNNAVTMLLGGTIGAAGAANVGDAVVLSAGRDVVVGDANLGGTPASPAASIQLVNATVTSPLTASANGDITLLAQNGGTLSLTGNTLAVADGIATLRAANGSTVNTSGNVILQSARFGLNAGTAQVIADQGGQINVKGSLSVLADADGVRRGDSGGSKTGGTATISSDGGTITASAVTLGATAVGSTAGSSPLPPTGQGGAASILLTNGAILNAGTLTIDASAGIVLGTAGTAAGGTVAVAVNGAQLNATTTSLRADGNAGGAGGAVSLAAGDSGGGGTITLGDTQLSASGAIAGRITLADTSSAASPAIRLASLTANALGTPAAGGPSFALNALGNRIAVTGSAAIVTGGDQSFIAGGSGGFDVGTVLTVNAGGAVSLTHNGNAGAVDTVNAGDVDATGQSITVAGGAILGAARTIRLKATGAIDAASLRAGTSIDGSAGGAVTLGDAIVTAPAQSNGAGGVDATTARIGFAAGVTGGAQYNAADLTVTGRLSANALIDLTAGADIRLAPTAALTSANRIRLTAGDDVLVNAGASVTAGQSPFGGNPANGGLDLSAGQLALAVPPPAGNVAAIIANGALSSGASATRLLGGAVVVTGPVTAGALTVDIAGTATGSDGGQLSGTCQGRDICLDAVAVAGNLAVGQGGTGTPGTVAIAGGTVGGSMLVNAATGIRLGRTAAAASLSAGGPTRLVSGGTIDLLGTFTLSSTGALGLRAGGGITGAAAGVRGNGDVALTSGGSVNLASLTVGGVLTGADANGLASGLPGVAGSATLGTLTVNGGDINLTAAGGITIGQVFVSEGRLVRLDAQASALRVTNIVGGTLGVAGGITLNGGSIAADRLQARGAINLTATGAVSVATDVAAGNVAARGSSVDLTAVGALTLNSIVATNGDANARSGGDLSVAAGQASGNLTLTAATTATLNGALVAGNTLAVTGQGIVANGSLRAAQIALRSATIQIGGAAQIGVAGTTLGVSFTNTGAGASFVGGAGGAGYSLTGAGLARVQSRDVAITLPGAVTIGDLALNGAASPAGTPVNLGGALAISTPGAITVGGALALSNATAANALTLNAGPSIRVVTPLGSVAILDPGKAPAGTLTLAADAIAVGSQAALTDVANAGDIAARNARLAANDGPVNDAGYLVAGGMVLTVNTALYIQNSGALSLDRSARRGFTVGAGGLTIATRGGPAEIVINGRQIGAGGVAITGDALIPAITLVGAPRGAALFDLQSTVNGCRIVPGNCPPVTVVPQTLTQVRDTIALVTGGSPGSPSAATLNGVIPPIILPAITINGADPYSVEPPIDEPVIGVGDEDTWADGTRKP